MEKLLTIVIPSYNMEKYLEKCCDSLIISENFELLEILIINDGSRDKTSEIAHSFQNKYSSVFRVIDKENGNYGSCINRGLQEATGHFIKILDSDDTYDSANFNSYVNFLSGLSKDNYDTLDLLDLIITDTIVVDEYGNQRKRKKFQINTGEIYSYEFLKDSDIKKLTHHCVTYRTDILLKMGYKQMEGLSYSDQEWVRLPLLNIQKFAYFPSVIYRYLVGREGQTMETRTFVKNMWMQIAIKKHILAFYDENCNTCPPINQKRFRTQMIDTIASVYAHYLLKEKNLLDVSELIEFDSFLKKNYKNFYNDLNSFKYSKLYPIRYIAYWRQSPEGWRYSMIFWIYSISVSIKNFIMKMLKRR